MEDVAGEVAVRAALRRCGRPGELPTAARIAETGRGPAREASVNEPWLSAEDIASHMGITKDTVYQWIAERGLPAHRMGRLWKFQASEVDDWVRSGHAGKRGESDEA